MVKCYVLTCLVGLIGVQASAQTCTTTTADLTSATVQAAITAATAGDTICLPPGSVTWTTGVTDSKGVTIKGAGFDVTVITDHVASTGAFNIVASAAPTFRITALTVDGTGASKDHTPGGLIEISGTGMNIRVDHVHIDHNAGRGILWTSQASGAALYGLQDHDTFSCTTVGGTCQAVSVVAGPTYVANPSASGAPFSRAVNLGSAECVYVEDSVFDFVDTQDGALEGYGGARICMRMNTVLNVTQGHHGADSGNYRGTLKCEEYGNAATAPASTSQRTHLWRSGICMAFKETWDAGYGSNKLFVTLDRDNPSCTNCSNWSICDGTHAWDQNGAGGGGGHQCLDASGWVFGSDPTDHTGDQLVGTYVWLERRAGVQQNVQALTGGSDLQANREFYNEDSANCPAGGANCTAGIGVGTLAQRPASCTTGVAFWATDQGSWNQSVSNPEGVQFNGSDGVLYKCTSTNTWTLYYTPYTYPHPLQATGVAGGAARSKPRLRLRIRGDHALLLFPALQVVWRRRRWRA